MSNNDASTSSIGVSDYKELISRLRKVWPENSNGYIIRELQIDCMFGDLPSSPSYTYTCIGSGRKSFLSVGKNGRIWHHGSKAAKGDSDAFALDLDSAAIIRRLCFVFMHPGMYGGLFGLWDLVTYVRGMFGVLHAEHAGDAARILVDEAESGVLASCSEECLGKILAEKLDGELGRYESMGCWRSEFRRALLFNHPEIAVAYISHMGPRNLYAFEHLLDCNWRC